MPDLDTTRTLDQRLNKTLIDRCFDETARTRHTGLPGSREDARHDTFYRPSHVDIREHNVRRLTPQFHLAGDEIFSRVAGNLSTGHRAAGEDKFGDAGMARKRVAGCHSVAGDDVEHARRKARLNRQFGERESRSRRMFRGFHDYRIAYRETRRE